MIESKYTLFMYLKPKLLLKLSLFFCLKYLFGSEFLVGVMCTCNTWRACILGLILERQATLGDDEISMI